MAVKASRLLVLPMLLLSVGLLLSGCAEQKTQTVSEAPERSELSSTSSSISESVTGSTDESKTTGPAVPEVPAAVNAGGGEEKDPKEEIKTAESEPESEAKKEDGKGGAAEIPAGNADSNEEAPEENIAPSQDSGGPVEIKFSEMYSGSSARGLKFSDKLTGLDGKKVVMTGYMAPPLKPAFNFFVLTRQPMSICPFCNSDASWPEDIVLIFLPKGDDRTPTDSVLRVTGTLELGSHTDPDTGFVSQARIYSDKIEIVR
ncbi:MAG: hypothetical protein VB106_01715 [Clostridiaceae bacterium]|nr:hypothetical protein [Clostridiaceae bacterium]